MSTITKCRETLAISNTETETENIYFSRNNTFNALVCFLLIYTIFHFKTTIMLHLSILDERGFTVTISDSIEFNMEIDDL